MHQATLLEEIYRYSNAVFSPEKELGTAVSMDCYLRDQQAPYLFI